jgi:uroporphyrinogen decarboxylase
VVEIGRQYPGLVILGGIDKRILASGQAAIDAELKRILPVMRVRGGYIPTSDHGVPAEVTYEDYLYYRRRCVELGSE